MSSGSFSHRIWRTPTHLLAGASLLFAALFSFIPLAATSVNAADISCSEMVAADVVAIASMCPNAPTNVSVGASDHGIEVEWDAVATETTQDNNAPTSFEVMVTPGAACCGLFNCARRITWLGQMWSNATKLCCLSQGQMTK